jgi:hypothetical protein
VSNSAVDTEKHTFILNHNGKYSNAQYILPNIEIEIDKDYIEKVTNAYFQVGYNWLYETIKRAVRIASLRTTRALYEFVRIMIPDSNWLDGFWFSALTDKEGKGGKGKDFVILDDIAMERSFLLATRSPLSLARSPASIVTEMTSEIVDFEDSAIGVVCAEKKPKDIELATENFYQSNTSFNLSMRAIWGDSVTCYPVVNHDRFLLVAFFQPQYKSVLIPFMDVHRERLVDIAKMNIGSIQEGFKIMEKVNLAMARPFFRSDVGELAGGFASAFVKGFMS